MTNKIEDGGPAFPHTETGDCGLRPGISMRDYFAAKALAGELASPTLEWGDGMHGPLATNAYKFADAMLEARK